MNHSAKKTNIESKEFVMANILRAEVATNCPCGGDAGHGGKTTLKLENVQSTAMEVEVERDTVSSELKAITLVFNGDHECETLIDALEFAAKSLRAMTAKNAVEETK